MPIQVQFHLQPPPLFCFLASLRLFLFHNQSACFICVYIIYYPVTLQSLHFVHFAGGHATHRLSKLLMLNRICSRNNVSTSLLSLSALRLWALEFPDCTFVTFYFLHRNDFSLCICALLCIHSFPAFAWSCYRYCYLGYSWRCLDVRLGIGLSRSFLYSKTGWKSFK